MSVQEQGTFWITNNFIWGWLLLPVLALGELIRRDAAAEETSIRLKSPGYFAITTIIIVLWLVTMPAWKWFLGHVMNVGEAETILKLTMISLIFYITFAFNNVIDSIFYGRGRTDLMLYQSLIVNTSFLWRSLCALQNWCICSNPYSHCRDIRCGNCL